MVSTASAKSPVCMAGLIRIGKLRVAQHGAFDPRRFSAIDGLAMSLDLGSKIPVIAGTESDLHSGWIHENAKNVKQGAAKDGKRRPYRLVLADQHANEPRNLWTSCVARK